MKWATPASSATSSRDPASTYAAIETDREPGRRAEMTRGPSASSVRSNIAADGSREMADRRPWTAGPDAARTDQWISVWIQTFAKYTRNPIETTHISGWISANLPRTTLSRTQVMNPAPMPTVMS